MGIQNVNSSSNVPEYKTPDDINLKPADVYDSQKIGNTLAGIENSVQRDLDNALQDGVIDNTEKNTLQAWLGQVKTLSKSISNIVSKTYEGYCDRLETVKKNIEDHLEPEDTAREPEETDAEQNKYNTQYYKELTKKANERLAELQKEKDSIEAEQKWYRKHSPFGYYGRTPEDAGEYAMKEIAQMFLGQGAVEDDANYLIQWANSMWTDGKISSGEKKILTDRADEKLASIRMQKARELAAKEQSDDNTDISSNNNNQAAMPKYDSKNDGHNTAWEAAGMEKES